MHNTASINKISIIAISVWLLMNIIQAICTPIHIDEAYYWMFSQYLDWGYFDHPPAVAILINWSDCIFDGTLGVRFFSIIAQLASFYLIYLTVKDDFESKNSLFLKLFLVFILLPLNHIFGFITTPDVPLLFSSALFFYALKGVVEKKDNLSYLLWTLSMGMMLYSKYHSGLVILLVLIGIPSLFKRWKTYISGGLALLMFLPHILWQYEHDWASIMYHLNERATDFKWSFPLEYLGNILVVFNPLLLLFLYKLLKNKWKGEFQRGCYFVMTGFLLFFFWQSFRVQVQAQWLIVLYIPSLLLMSKEIDKMEWKKIAKMVLWISPLFIAFRIFMIYDILPIPFNIHGNAEYVALIKKDAGERDVMFYGSYKRAAIYSWYTDQEYTHSYNGAINRKNQFNLWTMDDRFLDEDLYFVGVYSPGRDSKYYEDANYYANVVTYKTSDKLKLKVVDFEFKNNELVCQFKVQNPFNLPIHKNEKHHISIQYFNDKSHTDRHLSKGQFSFTEDEKQIYTLAFPLSENNSTNRFSLIFRHENLPYGPAYYKNEYNPR